MPSGWHPPRETRLQWSSGRRACAIVELQLPRCTLVRRIVKEGHNVVCASRTYPGLELAYVPALAHFRTHYRRSSVTRWNFYLPSPWSVPDRFIPCFDTRINVPAEVPSSKLIIDCVAGAFLGGAKEEMSKTHDEKRRGGLLPQSRVPLARPNSACFKIAKKGKGTIFYVDNTW